MKKRIWTVTPFFIIFSVIMLGMSVASYQYNKIIFLIELSVSIVSFALVIAVSLKFRKYIDSVVKSSVKNIDGLNESYLERFKMPVVVIGEHEEIVWYNARFRRKFGGGRNVTGESISEFINSTSIGMIIDGDGTNITCGERKYTAYANAAGNGTIIYFIDNTYYKNIEKEYRETHTNAALIVIDNREDFINDSEEENAHVVLNVENILQRWAATHNALYKRLAGNRYMIVFEEREIEKLISSKFKILDEVRSITLGDRTATVSIGIGRNAENLRESEIMARKALEMALGRGGDQVAIMQGDNYEFFGGVAQCVEKRSKVRTRVISTTLAKVIIDSEKVLVMGHKYSDLDCIGAGIGIFSMVTKTFGKHSHIVVDKDKTMAKLLIDKYSSENGKDVFISPEDALKEATPKTLLIIVDTHSPAFLESEQLYEKCTNVVVIDHHRKMVNYISNSIVFYHEPSSSSTSEMCSELVSYIGDKTLSKSDAEAMLAGIMLDTKSFVVKTGVRTFEAAAYLRQKGADTVAVKQLFADDLNTYKEKYKLVSSAELYNGCAIATVDYYLKDARLISAQAADELLSIEGVNSSFVIFKGEKNAMNISARSFGKLNVQVVMEKLGGGGHQTMAAVQFDEITVEQAKEKLIWAINETVS